MNRIYIVLTAFSLGGGVDVFEGDLVALKEEDARYRVHVGFLREASADEVKAYEERKKLKK